MSANWLSWKLAISHVPPNGMSKATVGPVQLTPTEPEDKAFPTRKHRSMFLEKTAAYRPNLSKGGEVSVHVQRISRLRAGD